MAEIALPIIALGGLYIMSNQKEKKENYSNIGLKTKLPNTAIPNKNYPVNKQPIDTSSKNYTREFYNANQSTDKFFKNDVSEKYISKETADKTFKSINGECFKAKDFVHQNMVPFFGSKVTQPSADTLDSAQQGQALLDYSQGNGSQINRKVEMAPFFKPQDNVQYTSGIPTHTDFYQSRVLPSQRIANVLPWEQEKVAPGLGLGYTTQGSGGFNSGMTDRSAWLPPTVDDLRSKSNPKVTYNLDGHEGPSINHVKNMGTIGATEKHSPDTDFEMGPQRWLTTTGASKAQASIPEHMLKHVNDCKTEYYGSGTRGDHTGVYTVPMHEESLRKQSCESENLTPATALNQAPGFANNYGRDGYKLLNNNRNDNCKSKNNGALVGVGSAVKGMFAPIMDILKPTRKEDVIYNANQLGNVQSAVPRMPVTNPQDQLKTTNKEMTADKIGLNYLNVSHMSGNHSGAYQVTEAQSKSQQRNYGDSSTHGNIGNTASTNEQMNRTAWSNQHNNINKTYENWPNPGGTQVFSSNINMSIDRRDEDRVNKRLTSKDFINIIDRPQDLSVSIPSAETFGKVNMPQQYNEQMNCDRMNPDLLQAFKSNPYTQSLKSF
tara:strand:+ start:1758 stop:3575 length:1818 start_codon:yes stop_codon:yes gene_type:complete